MFETPTPIIIKRGSSAEIRLDQIRSLPERSVEGDVLLQRDLKLLEAGVRGEKQVLFELENSHLPIYVLQDLCLEHDGLSSQIDFLVVTPYVNLVIECKNLFGNVTVNSHGEWIREFDYGDGLKREGIYSPITQNERHLQIMRAIKKAEKGVVGRLANNYWFGDWNRSVIVLANHRTILEAGKRHRELIVRADGLVGHIKILNATSKKNGRRSDKEMEEAARYWLSKHAEKVVGQITERGAITDVLKASENAGKPACPRCGSGMVLRVAKKGGNIGREFYGCSKYPKCRGIMNL